MEAVAKLNNYPTSPRKMRMVVDTIRGVNVDRALNILKFSEKAASKPLEKLLLSALNNWVTKNENTRIEDAELYVKTVFVDGGRILKRFRPAPMGRAYRIRKRSNHVTLVVDSRHAINTVEEIVEQVQEEVVEAPAPKKPAKKATTKKPKAEKAEKAEKPAAKKTTKTKKAKTE
jgi:large subunit ribosomal protein L22